MSMRLYDTARRAVVPFEPPPTVRMYVCGITPYDSTHLGHAATYLTYDLLIRRLEELGHEVRMVRNITDVDDSILPKARELGVPYLELAEAEMARFHGDMDALEMRAPDRRAARDRVDRRRSSSWSAGCSSRATRTSRTAPCTSTCRRSRATASSRTTPRTQMVRAGARARRQSRRSAPPPAARLRALAAVARRRARVARAVRRRSARLAHRVLGDGDARARPDDRPARRRHRSHLPAPRVRDRAEREPHRASRSSGTGCTRRWSATRARRCRSRSATSCSSSDLLEDRRPARDPARADAPSLPPRLRVVRHRSRRGHRAAAPAARRGRAPDRSRSRARSRSACATRSTTTSTRRARSTRSTTSRARSSPAATTRTRTRCCASSAGCSASTSSARSPTVTA